MFGVGSPSGVELSPRTRCRAREKQTAHLWWGAPLTGGRVLLGVGVGLRGSFFLQEVDGAIATI